MTTTKKNLLLLSGSKAAGNLPDNQKPGFLDWAEVWVKEFFAHSIQQQRPIMFVPYARAEGMSEKDYFTLVQQRLKKMAIDVVCAPSEGISQQALEEVSGIFVGGGHTPTLLYKLQTTGSLEIIRKQVLAGLPYLGSSAGTLITCPTIKTNNDMPGPANDIIDLKSLGLINAQINCHYMDNAMHDPKHQGETRDLRLKEFCVFNPNINVIGLYEGQALRVMDDKIYLWTSEQARGTATPVFRNDTRIEIQCMAGVPQDVSSLLR